LSGISKSIATAPVTAPINVPIARLNAVSFVFAISGWIQMIVVIRT